MGWAQSGSREHASRRRSPGVLVRTTAAMLIAVLLGGCTAHRRMLIPGQPPPRPDAIAVQPGDRVRVTLQSGKTTAMTVAEVRPDVWSARPDNFCPSMG